MKDLKNYNGEDRVVTSYDMLQYLEETGKRPIAFKSLFPTLDKYIGGFVGGEVTTISGVPGDGKTLFAQSLTMSFARQRIMSLWFSFEVQPFQFLDSFGLDLPKFTMPLTLQTNSILWLEERIIEAKQKYDIKAVFIDHLHFIIDIFMKQNLSISIGAVMRQLKQNIAIKHGLVVFLIAHTTKTKIDEEEGLEMGHIRDSGMVAAESDNIFFIWRVTDVENGAILKIAKDRKQGTRNKVIKLVKGENFLREMI